MKPPVASRQGSVLTITLAEPEKRNPLNDAVRRKLDEELAWLESAPDVRIVHMRGEGASFSAGADLRSQAHGPRPESWRTAREYSGGWQRTLERIERLPQVTVAELQGGIFGGAVLLAASCDVRIAAADAYFVIPELRLGLPLTWAGTPRLVREIGIARARDMVMTGRVVSAEEALAWGLVTRLVPRRELADAAQQLLSELLAVPEAPLAITKDQFAALSRAALGATAWADADLALHARRESESIAAREAYVARLRGDRTTRE